MIKKSFIILILTLTFVQVAVSPLTGELRLDHFKLFDSSNVLEVVSIKESSRGLRIWNNDSTCVGNYHIKTWIINKYGIKVKSFISNKEIQDSVFWLLWEDNKSNLGGLIKKFEGDTVKGIILTEEFILIGSFFAGSPNMKKFLQSKGTYNPTDGNSSIVSYINDYKKIKYGQYSN